MYSLESDTEAESQGVDTVHVVSHQASLVGGDAVVEGGMEAHASFPRVELYTHLGRSEESPRVLVALEDVVIRSHLCVCRTQFHAHVGLELSVVKAIVRQHTEGQLEERVLLSVFNAVVPM